jgi:tRNA nucleotidyltransferase (CCA-adding enzyme)
MPNLHVAVQDGGFANAVRDVLRPHALLCLHGWSEENGQQDWSCVVVLPKLPRRNVAAAFAELRSSSIPRGRIPAQDACGAQKDCAAM